MKTEPVKDYRRPVYAAIAAAVMLSGCDNGSAQNGESVPEMNEYVAADTTIDTFEPPAFEGTFPVSAEIVKADDTAAELTERLDAADTSAAYCEVPVLCGTVTVTAEKSE